MRKLLIFTLILISFAGNATGQVIPDYDRILLPLAIEPTPGVAGSLWVTEFWVYNDSSDRVALFPVRITDGYTLAPKTATQPPIFLSPPGWIPGHIVHVPRGRSEELAFNLRVRDVSRVEKDWGTEIPVVRESSFYSEKLVLLNIPMDDRFRQTLRVYAFGARGNLPGSVRVRAYPLESKVPLAEEVLTLQAVEPIEYVPMFGQMSGFREIFPLLVSTGSIRLEIDPLTEGLRFWAFVSVTNNETQLVTTVTPQ